MATTVTARRTGPTSTARASATAGPARTAASRPGGTWSSRPSRRPREASANPWRQKAPLAKLAGSTAIMSTGRESRVSLTSWNRRTTVAGSPAVTPGGASPASWRLASLPTRTLALSAAPDRVEATRVPE